MLVHNAVYYDTATLLMNTVYIVSLSINHSFSVKPKSWSTAIDSIYMRMMQLDAIIWIHVKTHNNSYDKALEKLLGWI